MQATIEVSRLSQLETVIERGLTTFVDVGMALAEIREDRLYRKEFDTFEDYCREKWKISRIQAYRLMSGAEAVQEMEMLPVGNIHVPTVTNERQARELAKIKDPVVRTEVWEMANEQAETQRQAVTAKIIRKAAETINSQEEFKQNGGLGKLLNYFYICTQKYWT